MRHALVFSIAAAAVLISNIQLANGQQQQQAGIGASGRLPDLMSFDARFWMELST